MEGEEGGIATKKRGKEGETETTRYKGIRMRKWGKWVAEIREPNKRSRIWLGSYSTPVAAARAYDTAVFHLRGPSARLNFPELVAAEGPAADMSAASIRKKATEVGARVDALHRQHPHALPAGEFADRVDLNKMPEPENSDCDYWDRD
ncbi:hypothetical protein AAZX31_17G163300 [Glycine max]|uniref:AP2/ERF domain-containing protein n=2 Tax=Glycine subgen. Soja TaxID=1462606 RepID=I1MVU7_SOYBN|nr:ethylene-responsive transcription factor ERF008 [Glycine max]XP_028209839.1 ethylene-responsive transcription factor ERF008-like [Glycine soja]KAG4930704.1 hypothetical protein JHK86_047665 [Glycine max]KAG4933472.1 hypothetical protein JHK87_047474 [Glycine soja]KAG4943637.1 hypothetical protein JHK85_048283 [Glycine max]KAG5097926.1 hypothetical protein JHK82_047780 [Glycine max]KAG5102722.1 hypothetical protein JHK84_047691 [Glycine max]|eukprot:XP_003551002.1 ethylene-responsive transcription factor ERF008 [Glycine max]